MLKKITIVENSLEPETWKTFECENVLEFLTNYFEVWPSTARIYNKNVNEICDVTPVSEIDVKSLSEMEGPFYVIVYPGAWWVPYIVMALVAVVMIAIMPKIPNAAIRAGSDSPSSNNALSDRGNKSRINARIPDIFGQVRSVPDLIALTYKYFENAIEVEHAYMCVGRGSYEISDIREETTPASELESCSIGVYGPNKSPNSGNSPDIQIGAPINIPIKLVTRLSSVTNQILDPNSDSASEYFSDLIFTKEGNIVSNSIFYTFSQFAAGNTLVIKDSVYSTWTTDETYPEGGYWTDIYNFDGSYLIESVAPGNIKLVTPWLSNSSWNEVYTQSFNRYGVNCYLKNANSIWVGPFIANRSDTSEIWCNFVADNGIYKDNGTTKTAIPVDLQVKVEPINDLNNVIGPAEYFNIRMLWNGLPRLNFGATLKITPSFVGRSKVSAKRVTPKYIISGYQVSEEVKWRDLYTISPIDKTNFGDVTTIQTVTKSNDRSLGTSERKLNLLATRKIPKRLTGETFSSVLYATKRADEIIAAVCLDRYIGNRNVSELDLDNIYSSIAEIISYFGTEQAAEFCYTFDSALSFEETISSIANSIFCLAYRRGSKIKLSFEKKTEISTILFNHRNKIPGTETRSVSFGNVNDNDGVEFQYVDPVDDAVVSIYLPSDKSAVNPKVVESIGIRNFRQAHFNANRIYNKVLNQTTCVEFEATQESNICVLNERILVSDGTRSGSFEGDIVNQNALELELSQDVDLQTGVDYTIFLQNFDGTVESIPITKTNTKNKIVLNQAPSFAIVCNFDAYSKTTFIITSNNDPRKSAFILTEKKPKGVMTSELTAINYTDKYYQNDTDFINHVIS